MGLTERHLFENEDVPENDEWALEDAVYNSRTNKKPEDSKDLAEKIYWILIEEGQHNLKFPLGSIITNTPDEVRDIIRKHIKDLT